MYTVEEEYIPLRTGVKLKTLGNRRWLSHYVDFHYAGEIMCLWSSAAEEGSVPINAMVNKMSKRASLSPRFSGV